MSEIIKNAGVSAVLDRRSIRKYTADPLSSTELATLMEAALQSPSARNAQPCILRVVNDRELMKDCNVDCKEYVFKPAGREGWDDPNYSFYFDAPTFMFIFGDKSSSFSHIDSGIKVENIAVAAQSIGLGSVIIGCLNPLFASPVGDKWRKALNVPDTHEIVIGIAVGHPAEPNPEPKPRDASKAEII